MLEHGNQQKPLARFQPYMTSCAWMLARQALAAG